MISKKAQSLLIRGSRLVPFSPREQWPRLYLTTLVTPFHSGQQHQRQSPAVHRELHTTTAKMASRRIPITPQSVDAPLTASATFLVLSINTAAPHAVRTVRSTLASVADLTKNVAIRDLDAAFACTVGIGADVWDGVTGNLPRPAELKPFRTIRGAVHTAVSTPGDIFFHIRAQRRDLCFEFERQLLDLLGDSVRVEDETVGFRYFDLRDLLGFVDGTANPVGEEVVEATIVSQEDVVDGEASVASTSLGGSYVVLQKYVHDLAGWRKLQAEQQEAIIGRTKLDNIELKDAAADKQKAHKQLATIQDENGEEYAILRDNMPFGSPGAGEFGTYFIGYSRKLWVIEKMLENMFVGNPPGLHDRILDFSTPLTGTTFFVPAASVLAGLGDDDDDDDNDDAE